jgi:lipoate-protein ligase A
MALDDALLEAAAQRQHPVLRFYSWKVPAATFGYSQPFHEVARLTPLRPLIRRPTGGGLVPHNQDWTYSLVLPPPHSWYGLRARASYQRVHEWVAEAFTALGVAVQLCPAARRETPGQCFVGAEQCDVLWHDHKIAGAAQRRNRMGLLIQGSIQPPAGMVRGDWEQAALEQAARLWHCQWRELRLEARLQCRAEKLARDRYGTAAFTERR